MSDRPSRRNRHATPAKRAVSTPPRRKHRRSLRAARLARGQHTAAPKAARHMARWALVLAFVPVLLVVATGAYALNLLVHTQRAVVRIAQPSVADVVHATALPPLADLRPTNTPDARGTIALLPTAPPAPPPLPPPDFARKDPFTVMLLGVEDQRNGPDDASRSDTIILASVDPLEKRVNLLSVPRDLRVTQPGGRGSAKMADVYANGDTLKYKGIGGVAFVWDTVEQNFQITIDYYVRANFDGFAKIVDTVGGVTVDNSYPIKDDAYPTTDFQFTRVFFPAGTFHLDGAEALQYVRTRHDDNDYARNARQQQVILSIREQAQRLNVLNHATNLIDTLGDTFRTDLPADQWIAMARFGIGLSRDAFHPYTLTDLLGDTTINGIFYSTVNWPQAVARAAEFSPKENARAIQAQASPGVNKGAKITVENATRDAGLASRWATALGSRGFTAATYIDAPANVKGNVATTRILYFGANKEAANAVASLLAVDASRVQDGSGVRPHEASADADIVVVLGDDVRDPGGASPP